MTTDREAMPRTAHDLLPGDSFTEPSARPLADWMTENGIRATVTRTDITDEDRDLHGSDPGEVRWIESASHWRVTFTRPRNVTGRLTVRYHMGSAHTEPPDPANVLANIADDAAGIESARSFEEWAAELGFDPDSRRAERIYRATDAQSSRLRRFLGDELTDALLTGEWSERE